MAERSPFMRAIDHAGMGAAVADEYLGGIPSAVAGLSPFTSYGRVKEAKRAALDDFQRTYPRLSRDVLAGSETPVSAKSLASSGADLAGFIGAGSLKALDKVRGTGWGSSATLEKAQEAVRKGAHPDEAFREHGHTNAPFGPDGPKTGWMTALDPRQINFKQMYGKSKSSLGEQIDAPELYATHPEVAGIRANLLSGSAIEQTRGGVVFSPGATPSRAFRDSFGETGMTPRAGGSIGLKFQSPTQENMKSGLNHEFTHLDALFPGGVPQGTSINSPTLKPTYDSDASKSIMARLERAKAEKAFPRVISELEEELYNAGKREAYTRNMGEALARKSNVMAVKNVDPRSVDLSQIDPYGPEAARALDVDPDWLAAYRAPFSADK